MNQKSAGRERGRLRQAHAVYQLSEPRIAAHRVEERVNLEVRQPSPPLLVRLFEPPKGLVGVVEAEVKPHECNGRHIASLRALVQLSEECLSHPWLTTLGLEVPQARERVGRLINTIFDDSVRKSGGSELWQVSFRWERTRRSTAIAVGEAGERCVI